MIDNLNKPPKISYKNTFELRYLRWRFVKKSQHPPKSYFDLIDPIIKTEVNFAYHKWIYNFNFAGIEKEDLENIIRVHSMYFYTVYFVDLFTKNNTIDKIKQDPNFNSAFYKTKNLIRQRLSEMADLCRKKNSLSVGFNTMKMYYINLNSDSNIEALLADSSIKWRVAPFSLASKIKKHIPAFFSGQTFVFENKLFKIVTRNETTCDIHSIYDIIENNTAFSTQSIDSELNTHEMDLIISKELDNYCDMGNIKKIEWLNTLLNKVNNLSDKKKYEKEVRIIKKKIFNLRKNI